MKTRSDLIAFFDAHAIAHDTTDHPAVFRVGEGEGIKDDIPGAHTKNLFLKDAKGRLWLISAQDDTAIDLKRLHTVIGSARLSFAKAEYMQQLLDITPGSVSVLGLMNDTAHKVQLLIDEDVLASEYVGCHPCINTSSLRLRTRDLVEKILPAIEHEFIKVKL